MLHGRSSPLPGAQQNCKALSLVGPKPRHHPETPPIPTGRKQDLYALLTAPKAIRSQDKREPLSPKRCTSRLLQLGSRGSSVDTGHAPGKIHHSALQSIEDLQFSRGCMSLCLSVLWGRGGLSQLLEGLGLGLKELSRVSSVAGFFIFREFYFPYQSARDHCRLKDAKLWQDVTAVSEPSNNRRHRSFRGSLGDCPLPRFCPFWTAKTSATLSGCMTTPQCEHLGMPTSGTKIYYGVPVLITSPYKRNP